jgi:hypothetical protein
MLSLAFPDHFFRNHGKQNKIYNLACRWRTRGKFSLGIGGILEKCFRYECGHYCDHYKIGALLLEQIILQIAAMVESLKVNSSREKNGDQDVPGESVTIRMHIYCLQ